MRYVSPAAPGIRRARSGRGFRYLHATGTPVRASATLDRIRAIAIPPAWTDVWICPDPNGHLQATGRDARGRRQYRYHARFRARRDGGKFARLVPLGERLPRIRRRVRADLARPGLPREKVLAAVVRLLESTSLRIGGAEYARLNRSFGLTTLRDRHATIAGTTVRFRFRGKGGRTEERTVVDRQLASVVRRCQDLPGQLLFQYLGDDGEALAIASEDVNAYLRDAAGSEDISAKDLRTWTATMRAYLELRAGVDRGKPDEAPSKRVVDGAVRRTAEALGNTPAVTRASYVHPAVITATVAPLGPRKSMAMPTRRDDLAVLQLLRSATRRNPAGRRTAATPRDS